MLISLSSHKWYDGQLLLLSAISAMGFPSRWQLYVGSTPFQYFGRKESEDVCVYCGNWRTIIRNYLPNELNSNGKLMEILVAEIWCYINL